MDIVLHHPWAMPLDRFLTIAGSPSVTALSLDLAVVEALATMRVRSALERLGKPLRRLYGQGGTDVDRLARLAHLLGAMPLDFGDAPIAHSRLPLMAVLGPDTRLSHPGGDDRTIRIEGAADTVIALAAGQMERLAAGLTSVVGSFADCVELSLNAPVLATLAKP